MTGSTEHGRRTPGTPQSRRHEFAQLHGRVLGTCAKCGRTVYLEHNFTRFAGRVIHVRCPITRTI